MFANGYRISFGYDENVLELVMIGGQLCIYEKPLTGTL